MLVQSIILNVQALLLGSDHFCRPSLYNPRVFSVFWLNYSGRGPKIVDTNELELRLHYQHKPCLRAHENKVIIHLVAWGNSI